MLHLGHVLRGASRIGRGAGIDSWPGPVGPTARLLEPIFQVADAGKVLIQPAAVASAKLSLKFLGLSGDRIQDAPPCVDFADLGFDLCGRAL